MTFRVEVSAKARAQFADLTRWWRENRPAKEHLLDAEVAKVGALLAMHPEAGSPYPRMIGVRRTLLRRTQIWIYYRIDRERRVVEVRAFWHTARGKAPQL